MIEFFIIAGIAIGGWLLLSTGVGASILTGLSYTQVAQYASDAGFNGDDLVTAVAIAFAESGGNTNSQGDYGNPIAGEYNAIGLMQINIGENPQYANDNLTDPQINMNDAYEIYSNNGSSFAAWSSYKSGAYQSFLGGAQNGVNQLA